MRRPRWIAVFCCLAILFAASLVAAEGPSPGRIALTVARPGGIALAVDLDALAQGLCAGGLLDQRASAECSLTAGNHRSIIDLRSGEATIEKDGRVSVEVTPSALDLAGTTLLHTPCGVVWQYSLQLDPTALQRPAPLTLHQATAHPAQGMFAGVIEVAAVLHLVPLDADGHPDEHHAIDLPIDITFQLAGAWATAPAPLPDSESSDLLLFAGFNGKRWRPRPGCEWTVVDGIWCESCLEAAPNVLEILNTKPF